jgi:hypothetical protein
MAGEYFADTFYWVALTYPRDSWHRQVVDLVAKATPLSLKLQLTRSLCGLAISQPG